MSKSLRVVLLLADFRAAGQRLMRGIAKYANINGPWSFFYHPPFYLEDEGKRKKIFEDIKSWKPDGVIAWDVSGFPDYLLKEIPLIVAFDTQEKYSYPYITTDYNSIGQIAAKHFIERGFKNFAFCGYSGLLWSDRRGMAFQKTIESFGFQTYIYDKSKSSDLTNKAELFLISDWLGQLPKPIAVMTCNDERARDIVQACIMSDIKIPDEVAVIGVDNDEIVCELSNPQISSISLDDERAGFKSAEVLHRMMKGECCDSLKINVNPTHVVIRNSTDVLAIEDKDVVQVIRKIRENARNILQVSDVLGGIPVSRRTLERRFRKAVGHSIFDEIRKRKMDLVAKMLIETNNSITRIAYIMGYSGVDHISRIFKKEKGVSLQAYRKKHRS